jgi:hypothetical protein
MQSSDSDLSYSYRRLFYRGISRFLLKYEARIAIFRILAAIDRFSQISQKVESRWGKSESCWRNRKAVEESGKPLKTLESRWRNWKAFEEDFLGFLGNWKAIEENQTLSEENRILREGNFGEII